MKILVGKCLNNCLNLTTMKVQFFLKRCRRAKWYTGDNNSKHNLSSGLRLTPYLNDAELKIHIRKLVRLRGTRKHTYRAEKCAEQLCLAAEKYKLHIKNKCWHLLNAKSISEVYHFITPLEIETVQTVQDGTYVSIVAS